MVVAVMSCTGSASESTASAPAVLPPTSCGEIEPAPISPATTKCTWYEPAGTMKV